MTGPSTNWKVGCTIFAAICQLAVEPFWLTTASCGCLLALYGILSDLVLLVLGIHLYNLR